MKQCSRKYWQQFDFFEIFDTLLTVDTVKVKRCFFLGRVQMIGPTSISRCSKTLNSVQSQKALGSLTLLLPRHKIRTAEWLMKEAAVPILHHDVLDDA